VIAGILAAAMSTIASSINALASSVTHDLYATWTGVRDPVRLLAVGRRVSLIWGLALIVAALGFNALTRSTDTPAVVLALSIASVTYGALLGAYLLAGARRRIGGRDVIRGATVAMLVMLVTVFASRLGFLGMAFLADLGRLAWPWYVPMGTLITLAVAELSAGVRASRGHPA
jgi:Na+/proline symporter